MDHDDVPGPPENSTQHFCVLRARSGKEHRGTIFRLFVPTGMCGRDASTRSLCVRVPLPPCVVDNNKGSSAFYVKQQSHRFRITLPWPRDSPSVIAELITAA